MNETKQKSKQYMVSIAGGRIRRGVDELEGVQLVHNAIEVLT